MDGARETYDYELIHVVPAHPREVYGAWLSSAGHSAMTGSPAVIDPTIGGEYSAWDGYITGVTRVLEPESRIVQSWRATDFADDDADSQIDVFLVAIDEGTRLTLRHTNVPDDNHNYEEGGWQESYFEPMSRYFAQR